MAEQEVTLNPGESKVVSFEATPSEARAYQVSVDGLTGSFTAVAPVGVQITSITVSPASLTDAVHEYETPLGIGYWGDPFTVSITVSNPFDTDVWARPDYALGLLTGEPLKYVNGVLQGFNAKKLLYFRLLLSTAYIEGDFSYTTDWQKPWDAKGQNKGSNMVLGIYDPDGVPRTIGGADYWLKIPPGGSITTVKEAHLGKGISSLVPGVFDLCAVAARAYYLVYDPGYGTQRVGGRTVVVNWRPVELAQIAVAVPDLVTITPA